MSRPVIRSGQWSQTTTGITQPAARLNRAAANVPIDFKTEPYSRQKMLVQASCHGASRLKRPSP